MKQRTTSPNSTGSRVAVLAIALFAFGLLSVSVAFAEEPPTGGVGTPGGGTSTGTTPTNGKIGTGTLRKGGDGECDKVAVAPADAPPAIQAAIDAGNRICNKPYIWGGGHGNFEDNGYDCSGAVSYLLHAAGVLSSPLDSGSLARLVSKKSKKGKKWKKGLGNWITVAANGGHTYIVVAGLRMDTSGSGGKGPRWFDSDVYTKTNGRFTILHPKKF